MVRVSSEELGGWARFCKGGPLFAAKIGLGGHIFLQNMVRGATFCQGHILHDSPKGEKEPDRRKKLIGDLPGKLTDGQFRVK